MPKRYDTKKAIDFLYKHGYRITKPNWHYQTMTKDIPLFDLINNKPISLSLNAVEKLVSKKRNPRLEYNPADLDKLYPIEQPKQESKQPSYDKLRHDYVKQLKQACDKNLTVIFDVADNARAAKDQLVDAIDYLRPQLLKHSVLILLTSKNGDQKYFHLTEYTFDLIDAALFNDDIPDIHDSNTEILYHFYVKELATITFEIQPPKKPSRHAPGFFPFVNKSGIDLTEYGIYSEADNPMLFKESCLITV